MAVYYFSTTITHETLRSLHLRNQRIRMVKYCTCTLIRIRRCWMYTSSSGDLKILINTQLPDNGLYHWQHMFLQYIQVCWYMSNILTQNALNTHTNTREQTRVRNLQVLGYRSTIYYFLSIFKLHTFIEALIMLRKAYKKKCFPINLQMKHFNIGRDRMN